MLVYTLYTPETSAFIRLWALSWQRRGWKTRLLTKHNIRQHGSIKGALPKGAIFVKPSQINFGLPPARAAKVRARKFPARGWESAPVVQFEREYDVLNCGRHI